MTALPRIAIVGTGGTISGVGKDRLDFYEYGTSGRFMKVDELIATVPELPLIADIVPVLYKNVASTELGPVIWLELLDVIHQFLLQFSFSAQRGRAQKVKQVGVFEDLRCHV